MSTLSTYFGDGSNRLFNVTFSFATQAQVKVRVDGTDVTFTWSGPAQVQTTTAPAAGALVEVYRWTDVSVPVVDFSDGALLLADELDASINQPRSAAEELASEVAAIRGRMVAGVSGEAPITLPNAAARASRYFAFGIDGQPLMIPEGGDGGLLRAQLLASTGSSLVAFIAAGAGAGALSVQDKLREFRSVKDFGAAGNGTTDDRAALVAANEAGPFRLPPGDYKVASSVLLNSPIEFAAGARLVIPTGVTVTFGGAVHAGLQELFVTTGTGKVVFNSTKNWLGYPEWWGAKADLTVDCTAALHAARDALLVVQLQAGDYFITSTVKWNLNGRALLGAGSKFNDQPAAQTRLVMANGSDTILQVGPDTQPAGGTANLPQGIVVRDLYLGRSVAPVIASAAKGLDVRWVLYGDATRIKTADNMIGARANGTVHFKFRDCEFVRSQPGSGAGTDYFVGHWADGSGSVGLAGGNASLYIQNCSAGANHASLGALPGSVGFKADGAFTDLFYKEPETVGFNLGQAIFGNNATDNGLGNTDLFIDHPIHDQFHNSGIYVTDVARSGSVEIVSPYFGPATDARAAIYVNSCQGSVAVRGGQFVMGAAPGVQAILASNAKRLKVTGFPLVSEHGNTFPIVSLDNCSNAHITVNAVNENVSAGAVIQLFNTVTASVFEPSCSGKASAYQYGIQVVGTGDNRNEYRMTGLDSTALVAANRKLDRNGVAITATGLTDTNLVAGVMT